MKTDRTGTVPTIRIATAFTAIRKKRTEKRPYRSPTQAAPTAPNSSSAVEIERIAPIAWLLKPALAPYFPTMDQKAPCPICVRKTAVTTKIEGSALGRLDAL